MRNLFILLFLLIFTTAYSQFYLKEVAHINAGVKHGYIPCGDTDNDGFNELIFNNNDNGYITLQVWEYRPTNHYELVWFAEGGQPPQGGILVGNFAPNDIGDIDRDGLADLVGPNQEYEYDKETVYELFSTQESPDFSSLPESLNWYLRFDYRPNCSYYTDLDRDSLREILSQAGGIVILENTGNNQNEIVFDTMAPATTFTCGDFDMDGKEEFVTAWAGSLGRVFVYENIGDNHYELVYVDTTRLANGWDVFSGNDLDGDGKPEFFIAFAQNVGGSTFDFYLYMWEMTGNNTYERTLIDVFRSSDYWSRRSKCGDIDGDSIEEIVWSIGAKVFVYKATGNNQFQRLWEWTHPYVACSQVNIYDMNQNGYNEIVITGWDDTWLYEIEAVRLLSPNGGQNFIPGDSVSIQWQKFYPPRCDSFSLSYTTDNGRTYQPILNSIPPTESTYTWIVPNTPSESCRVKVTAYGPGTQFDESDALFTITGPGIEEGVISVLDTTTLNILPNPFESQTTIRLSLPTAQKISLKLYDITGKLTKVLCEEKKNAGIYRITLDSKGLASGVYLVSLQTESPKQLIERVIIVK